MDDCLKFFHLTYMKNNQNIQSHTRNIYPISPINLMNRNIQPSYTVTQYWNIRSTFWNCSPLIIRIHQSCQSSKCSNRLKFKEKKRKRKELYSLKTWNLFLPVQGHRFKHKERKWFKIDCPPVSRNTTLNQEQLHNNQRKYGS